MGSIEIDHYNNVLSVVQHVMREKLWYTYHTDGSYDWPGSVHAITQDLQTRLKWNRTDLEQELRLIMENSFTPDSLTMIHGEPPIPFVQAMTELGHAYQAPVYMWTVGDVTWQRTKFEKSQACKWIPDTNFHAVPRNKHEELHRIMHNIHVTTPDALTHMYVIDDKWSNLDQVLQLKEEGAHIGIHLYDYHLKLADEHADPNACYLFIRNQLETLDQTGERSAIVLDFDGVSVNSDATLFHTASVDIAGFYFAHA